MRVSFYIFIIAILGVQNLWSQDADQVITGEVTFVTTQNIYVRFLDTEAIDIGDSLILPNGDSGCLVVKSKSSTSCVCSIKEGCSVEKGSKVQYRIVPKEIIERKVTTAIEQPILEPVEEGPLYQENIRGRISVSSQSTIASDRDDRHRFMGRLLLNADHIKNSNFSFNTYMNYRQILDQGATTTLQKNSLFRIYNLGVRYDATPSLSLTLGRNINPKTSSLGAIDGLQVEKYFGKKYIGGIVGFRPDFFNFGFNANLLQYGGYVGMETDTENFYSQTSVGFIQQQNGGEIDRRYTYFQHNSTISKDLNIFSSMELDLFSKMNNMVSNELRLTNLYISTRYRFSRRFNVMLSYDSRKRILYYETFQTEIERLLDDDIARQGARIRVNFRPSKNIYLGGSYSKRFQNNTENKSDNIYGYITLSQVPNIGGRLSLAVNRNVSNYLTSNIGSLRYSKNFFRGRMNSDVYYRLAHYDYVNNIDPVLQHFGGLSMSYNITRKLWFSISGEYTTYNQENNIRIFSRIIQRF